MLELVKGFLKEEDGMGTLELVIIIGVLVALALLFKEKIGTFASGLMDRFFKVEGTGGFNLENPPQNN